MKIKKLFAGLVATSMVAAMGTSAFAATLTETTEGSKASVASLPASSGQMTVLVAKIDANSVSVDSETGAATVSNPTITDETIIYIDQDDYSAGMFQNMGLKTTLKEGDYFLVRVGGQNLTSIHEEIYKVVKEGGSDTPSYTLGDINDKDGVNVIDANLALQYCAELITFSDTQLLAADVNGKDGVNVIDANLILQYCAELITSFPAEQK